MNVVKRVSTQAISNPLFLGLIIQLLLASPFLWLFAYWSQYNALFVDPALDLDLLNLVPSSVQRFGSSILICAVALFLFYYFDHRRLNDAQKSNPLNFWVIALVSLGAYLMVAFRTLQFPVCVDAAYVDFRYAFKWAHGLGFDYNSGERILGFSSYLNLFLLTILNAIFRGVDVALLSQLNNALLQIATYLLIFVTARSIYQNQWMGLLACSIFAFSPDNLTACLSGKEAPLVVFLLALSIWSAVKQKWKTLTWSNALLALTRPEGIIWFLTNLIYFTLDAPAQERKSRLKTWLFPSIFLVLFFAIVFLCFGTITPHAVLARLSMYQTVWEPSDKMVFFILKHLGIETFGSIAASIFSPALQYEIAWAAQGAFAFILFFEIVRQESLKPVRAYVLSAIILLFFISAANPWTFSWYYSWFSLLAPFVLPFIIFHALHAIKKLASFPSVAFMLGLSVLCNLSVHIANLPPARLSLLRASGPMMSFLPLIKTIRTYPFGWSRTQERLMLYKRAAQYFNQAESGTSPESVIATIEPGVLGYLMPSRKILDLGGLVSKEALKYYPVPSGERSRKTVWGSISPQAIAELKPEYCLFLDCFAENGLMSDNNFLGQYELIKFFPGYAWGSKGLYIFHRMHNEVSHAAH